MDLAAPTSLDAYDFGMRMASPLLVLALAACGGAGSGEVPVPEGVTFRVEQARQDMQGRRFQLQVANRSSKTVTVSRVDLVSGRLDRPSVYRGPATIPSGTTTNLTMTMSRARCGTDIDASATVTYRSGDRAAVVSTVRPKDHYGSVALFMKRDCAERAVGTFEVDPELTPRGRGKGSVLAVGMTFTPRAGGGPVRVGPLGGTTLLKPRPGAELHRVLSPGSGPQHAVVEIIPNRCNVHVVAEDRTGATMPMAVQSEASGDAFFFVRFTEAQRTQIFDFIADHCGFGVEQDPLLAP